MTASSIYEILKSGYVKKQARRSKRNWKTRYFLLTSGSLIYYDSHESLKIAKGDVLLTKDTVLEVDEANDGENKRLNIHSSFGSGMTLEFDTAEECVAWKDEITNVIQNIKHVRRGYAIRQKGVLSGGHKRLFFVLHKNGISSHSSHEDTANPLEVLRFTAAAKLIPNDSSMLIELVNPEDNVSWRLQFDVSGTEYTAWKEEIATALQSTIKMTESIDNHKRASELLAESNQSMMTIRDEILVLTMPTAHQTTNKRERRPTLKPSHGVVIEKKYIAVLSQEMVENDIVNNKKAKLILLKMNDDGSASSEVFKTLIITKTCGVCCKNEDNYEIDLLLNKEILHLKANDIEHMNFWLENFNHTIYGLKPNYNDPIMTRLAHISASPYFLNAEFSKDSIKSSSDGTSLGMAMEKYGQWAVVQIADRKEIKYGDVLNSINNENIGTNTYEQSMLQLTSWDWNHKLNLKFLRLPSHSGYLVKVTNRPGSVWRNRFFELSGGKLSYKRGLSSGVTGVNNNADDSSKGDVYLYGATISLVKPEDAGGRLWCLQLLKGYSGMIMQAMNKDQMMRWVGYLQYTISVLNKSPYYFYEGLKRAQNRNDNNNDDDIDEEDEPIPDDDITTADNNKNYDSDSEVPPPPPLANDNDDDDDDDLQELSLDMLPGEKIYDPTVGDHADENILKELFLAYSKRVKRQSRGVRGIQLLHQGDDPHIMNPMGLSNMFRLANPTDKGDIMKQMQLFQKFDVDGDGHLELSTFISGWTSIERSKSDSLQHCLKEMYKLKGRTITML